MFCDQCGERFEGHFCGQCGARAVAPVVPSDAIPASPPADPGAAALSAMAYPDGAPTQRRASAGQIGVIALVAAIALVGGYLALRPGHSGTSQAASTANASPSNSMAAAQPPTENPTAVGGLQDQPTPSAAVVSGAPSPTTSSWPTQTPTPQRTVDFEPIEQRYSLYHQASGFGGRYSSAATLHSTTTEPFMRDVAESYAAHRPKGGVIDLSGIYSFGSNTVVYMECRPQSDDTVLCTGGRAARVLLFN